MMNKNGVASVFLVLVVLALLGGAVYTGLIKVPATITGSGGSYIERSVFKYDKCEAIGPYSYSAWETLSKSGGWLVKPSATNKYDVQVKAIDSPLFTCGQQIEYYVCNSKSISESNCRIYSSKQDISKGDTQIIHDVRPTESVWIQYQSKACLSNGFKLTGSDGAQTQIGFIPYGIREYNVLGGSATQINPNSCEVGSGDSSWTDRFISSDSNKINVQISKNTNERVLQPEEVRWYVSGYVTSAEPSFKITYKGQNAWCKPNGNNAEVYKINTLVVGSGTYKIASTDFSDLLGTETCCPGDKETDKTCNSNFQWVSTLKAECSAFNPCGGSDWTPYSSKQLIRYTCQNSQCVAQTKSVSCVSNADCLDSNQVCDLNSYQCVNANVNLDGQVIETVPDNSADCDLKGGKWITQKTEQTSFWNIFGIGSPTVVTKEYCDMSKTSIWTILFIIGTISVILYFFRGQLMALYKSTIGRFL